MDRIGRITDHPLWQEHMALIARMEQTRIFCGHGPEHLLDVARLAYIEDLEQGLGIPRELIYAAALLHDIGRGLQYRDGIPHHIGGARLAEEILKDCGFSQQERQEITEAIGAHRSSESGSRMDLGGILYRADKASRQCQFCAAQAECNWPPEKKNLHIRG